MKISYYEVIMSSTIAKRNYIFNTGGDIALRLSSNNSFTLSNDTTLIGPTTLSNTLTVSGDIQARSNMYILQSLGVGTSNPVETVDIIGNTRITGTFVSSGSCIIRKSPGQIISTDSNNIFQFYEINGFSNNNSNIYISSPYGVIINGKSNIAVFNDSNVYIKNKIGIGAINPSYPLHVMGQSNNISIFAEFGITQFSDERLKKDILRIQNALDNVSAMNGYSYLRVDSENPKRMMGVIAQEIEKVVPDIVHNDEITGLKSVSYIELIPLLIEAIKELKQEKDNEISLLKNKIEILEKMILL